MFNLPGGSMNLDSSSLPGVLAVIQPWLQQSTAVMIEDHSLCAIMSRSTTPGRPKHAQRLANVVRHIGRATALLPVVTVDGYLFDQHTGEIKLLDGVHRLPRFRELSRVDEAV
jgi:hypothetical protein